MIEYYKGYKGELGLVEEVNWGIKNVLVLKGFILDGKVDLDLGEYR